MKIRLSTHGIAGILVILLALRQILPRRFLSLKWKNWLSSYKRVFAFAHLLAVQTLTINILIIKTNSPIWPFLSWGCNIWWRVFVFFYSVAIRTNSIGYLCELSFECWLVVLVITLMYYRFIHIYLIADRFNWGVDV